MKITFSRMRWLVVAVLVVLGWLNYHEMISYTMMMFSAPIEDMSHGWIVPFVSAYVIWHRRQAFRDAAGLPSLRGFLWVCFFVAVGWFGGRGGQSRIEQASLIGLIWAIPYAFWGKGVSRQMLFPAWFLVFTIPMSSFTDLFTVHLRIISSSLATAILNGVGISVEQSGTALFSRVPGAEFNVDVADPCSGIRSLFAMISLTATYAYFTQKTLVQKWALFVCSVPLAMVGNIIRIMSICVVATWFGQEAATGYYHDYSGYVVFLVGVLLMIKAGQLIAQRHGFMRRLAFAPMTLGGEPSVGQPEVREPARADYVWVWATLVLMAGLLAFKWALPPPAYDSADFIASVLPKQVPGFSSAQPWFCHNEQCLECVEDSRLTARDASKADAFACPKCGGLMQPISLGEMRDLPKDTVILKRNYHASDGLVYSLSVVIGGRKRNSIHRVELCLPAQGYVMLEARRVSLHVRSGAPKAVRKVTAQQADGQKFCLLYWFVSKNRECCSHTQRILTDVWDRSIHNRINRWVMVAINVQSTLDTPEALERVEAFLSEVYPRILSTAKQK